MTTFNFTPFTTFISLYSHAQIVKFVDLRNIVTFLKMKLQKNKKEIESKI